jgi:hypothetical protein
MPPLSDFGRGGGVFVFGSIERFPLTPDPSPRKRGEGGNGRWRFAPLSPLAGRGVGGEGRNCEIAHAHLETVGNSASNSLSASSCIWLTGYTCSAPGKVPARVSAM